MPHWYDQITDKFVANVANRYMVESGIEAFDVFPQLSVRQLSGYIAKYTKDAWFKIGTVNDYKRAGAVESIGDDYAVTYAQYVLEEYAFHKDVSKDDRNEYDNPFDPVRDAIEFVMTRLKRVLMQNMTSTFLAASVWTTEVAGGTDFTAWSTGSTGTPVNDVLTWREEVHKITGYWPNKMIIGPDVYRILKSNDDITAKMKTTSDKVVTKDVLARLFEIDKLVIFDAVNTTATDHVFTDKALLVYTPDRPSKFAPSAGYNLIYRGKDHKDFGTSRIPMREKNDALRIEAWVKSEPKVLAADLGVYATNVVA